MPRNDNVNDDIEDDDEDDSQAIRNMRKRIKELEKNDTDAVSLKRENAMLRAGIDIDSKLGKMFLRTYEGDLSDIDAIKTEATEIGLIKAAEAPPAETDTTETKDEVTDTAERRTLANGGLPDDKQPANVTTDALAKAEAAIDKGMTFDKAAGGFIAAKAAAAMAGDTSVLVQ
jgi:hypothetical protein